MSSIFEMTFVRALTGNRRSGLLTVAFVLLSATVGEADSYGQDASCDGCDAAQWGCSGGTTTLSLESACRRWESMKCVLEEDCGIGFEGAVTQFYQGVSSGGLQRQFKYGGHGDYDFDFDMGKICGLDGLVIELGSEHRFAESVNPDTGSVVPVALLPNLPEPEINDLALTKILGRYEIQEGMEVFLGKIDTLDYDTNDFADGKGNLKFLSTAFNYNPIATRTIPFSTLGGGVNLFRDDERVFTFAVLDTEDTGTIIAIDDLFSKGVVLLTELRLPVTILGRRGHQMIGGSWSSKTFTSLDQTGRIEFPDIAIAEKSGSWSLFWNADQYLWQDPCDNSRGWGLFGRAGVSDGNPNPIEWFVSAGIGGASRIEGREDDRFGLGWYYTGLSDEFGPVLDSLLNDGQGVEMFYDIAVSEHLRLTLDFQIVDPNSVGTDWALVPGLRTRIEF